MVISSFNVAVSALVSVPISLFIPVALLWIFAGFWWAFGYFLAFPVMFILAWNYMRLFWKFIGTCNFIARKNRVKVNELRELRTSIFSRLDSMLY